MEIRYPALLEPQQNGSIFVRFPDMEDVFTEGGDEEEALRMATEVLTVMLAVKLDHGQEIPEPSQDVAGAHQIAPDAKTQAALLIRKARGARPLAELARALETSWPSAKRLEDPNHWPSLKQLDRAASALGGKLVLTIER